MKEYRLRRKLYKLIKQCGLLDPKTIAVRKQLDLLIVEQMRKAPLNCSSKSA